MTAPWSVSHDATYPGYALQLGTRTTARFDPVEAVGERLRLVLADGGGGLLVREGRPRPFRAPAVFCLDEREAVSIEARASLELRLLYFHPTVLHHELRFERLRGAARDGLPVAVHQDAFWLEPFLLRDGGQDGVLEPGALAWKRLVTLFERVQRETTAFRDDSWPCRSRTYLIELLFFLTSLTEEVREQPAELLSPEVEPRVREVLVYLHAHYGRALTVAELARRFGTNRTSLQHAFAAATGRPVMEYLTGLRVEVAQAMLRDTLLPVSEIAERTGYADAASFSRVFRKLAGATPSEYRDRTGWMQRAS